MMTGSQQKPMLARWAAFCVVGLAGLVTQLMSQWVLIVCLNLPVLVATALATELAIVHNFFWHARITWADRWTGRAAVARRFARFNLSTGAISMSGNLLVMALLTEGARMPWLAAQMIGIAICSLANFWFGDIVVFSETVSSGCPFGPGQMKRRAMNLFTTGRHDRPARILAAALLLAVWSTAASAADLEPRTVAAFDRYAGLTEARLNAELAGTLPFLWVDTLTGSRRSDEYARLRRGEVIVARLEPDTPGHAETPGGMCHDWVGTVFIPGARLDDVLRLMQAYDRYADVYRPAIRKSRLLSREGDRFKTDMQLYAKKVISVVLNAQYDVLYMPAGTRRMQVRSWTTRIAEVEQPDTPQEREKPVGHDSGFLWRMNTYCSLDDRDEGTYVQCESVSLSRDIPTGLGWLVGPFVTSVPRDSLEFTLEAMRARIAGSR
jgi:putative flippase GtrA